MIMLPIIFYYLYARTHFEFSIIITIQTHTLDYAYECSMNIQFNPSQTVFSLTMTHELISISSGWKFIVRRAPNNNLIFIANFSLPFSSSLCCAVYVCLLYIRIINNFPLVKYSKSLSSSAFFFIASRVVSLSAR